MGICVKLSLWAIYSFVYIIISYSDKTKAVLYQYKQQAVSGVIVVGQISVNFTCPKKNYIQKQTRQLEVAI